MGSGAGGKKKKLEDAARHWARGGKAEDRVADDLAKLGAPEEVKRQWAARVEQEQPMEFEVLPESVPAVELFIDCASQWRYAGMSGAVTGLDYAGVRALAAMTRRRISPDLFADLQIMEFAALSAWAEARK